MKGLSPVFSEVVQRILPYLSILLGGYRKCQARVSCPTTQHYEPSQGFNASPSHPNTQTEHKEQIITRHSESNNYMCSYHMAQHAEASEYSGFLVYRLLSVTGICCCSYGHQSHRLDRNQSCIPPGSDIQLRLSRLPHRCSWETCIFHKSVWEEAEAASSLQRKDIHLYIKQVENLEAIVN